MINPNAFFNILECFIKTMEEKQENLLKIPLEQRCNQCKRTIKPGEKYLLIKNPYGFDKQVCSQCAEEIIERSAKFLGFLQQTLKGNTRE
jgi:predicted RNA-binding Zn-ribbon protein involved in translation (DUF1610 family)